MEPGSTPRPLVQKKTWRDSVPIDMLLSAVSVLAVAQSSSEIPEGLMNNPVQLRFVLAGANSLVDTKPFASARMSHGFTSNVIPNTPSRT